jgi:hypothetical protein
MLTAGYSNEAAPFMDPEAQPPTLGVTSQEAETVKGVEVPRFYSVR